MSDTAQREEVKPARQRQSYTDEQKETALAIYVERGVAAAASETGIIAETISSWASRAGLAVVANENRLMAIEASQTEFERRFANLKGRMLTEAEGALERIQKPFTKIVVDQKGGEHEIEALPEPADQAKLGTLFGILFDKLQLMTGGSTSNVLIESPSLRALVAQQNAKNEEVKAALLASVIEGEVIE